MVLEVKKVSQVVIEIKNLLEAEFTNISIEGEVSNLSLSSSGHWYFTLSDKDSSLSAALFKMDALRNPQIKNIKDGVKVIVAGDINVYPKKGTFQVIVKRIVVMGQGDLKEQFEKLKRKLSSEGLFDLDKKMSIPLMPKRTAIITAQRGAALQDFINIYKRRSIWMDLIVVPAIVQGDDAPRSIRTALNNIIKFSLEATPQKKVDLIVLARGGGSLEDLWAFNDEGLAFDIFNCPIPIISAIGHEVDFSISDFVADLRAETPSAAAEIITQEQTKIIEKMKTLKSRLRNIMTIRLNRFEIRLKKNHPQNVLSLLLNKISLIQKKLNRYNISKRLHELTNIHNFYLNLDDCLRRLDQVLNLKIKDSHHSIERLNDMLNALNPKNVLERGYGYVEDDQGKVVSSCSRFDELPPKSLLTLHLHDGDRKVIKNEISN